MDTDDAYLIAETRFAVRSGEAALVRQTAGLSQSEVAAAIGVTPSAVNRWERGERVPRGAAALRYGRLLKQFLPEQVTAGVE